MYKYIKGENCNCNDCDKCSDCSCEQEKCCKPDTCGCKIELSTNCVRYEGADLPCANIKKGERLESILKKLDIKLCEVGSSLCEDGQDGADGAPGPKGDPGSDGTDGADGQDGQNGVDGVNGIDGTDGVGIQSITQNPLDDCQIIFTLTDGSQFTYDVPGCNPEDSLEYTYTAFASDITGTNFTTDPALAVNRCFMAIITSLTPLTPSAPDFSGQWFQYKYIPKEYVDSKSLNINTVHPGGLFTDTNTDIIPSSINIPSEYIDNTDCVAEINFHFQYEPHFDFDTGIFNAYYTINGNPITTYADLNDLIDIDDSGEIHVKMTVFRLDSSTIRIRTTVWTESVTDDDGEIRVNTLETFNVNNTQDVDVVFGVQNIAGAAITVERTTNTYGYTLRSINPQIGC